MVRLSFYLLLCATAAAVKRAADDYSKRLLDSIQSLSPTRAPVKDRILNRPKRGSAA